MRAITTTTMAVSKPTVTAQTVMALTAITARPTSTNRLCLRTTTYSKGKGEHVQCCIGVG